jgi:hypothetical protein
MQTLLLETMVRTQQATLKMPLMEGRTLSRKKKNDYTKTLGDWTEMQCDTPRALQVRYRKTSDNLWVRQAILLGISLVLSHHPHLEGPKPLLTWRWCNYIERGHLTHQCSLVLNHLGNSTLAESSRMTLEDESTMKCQRYLGGRGCLWMEVSDPRRDVSWRQCARGWILK